MQQHSENEWTAGPWSILRMNAADGFFVIGTVGPNGPIRHIAEMSWPKDDSAAFADACLIRAAPDLAVAAQNVLAWWDNTLATHLLSHKDFPWAEDAEWDQFADLRAALAKATSK